MSDSFKSKVAKAVADVAIAAKSIKDWAYSDSLVVADFDRLLSCVSEDAAENKRAPPTSEECEALVCASEDEDPGLAELKKQFPRTDTYLNELWGV